MTATTSLLSSNRPPCDINPRAITSHIIFRPRPMSSAVDEAALAKVYQPDTATNLSPDNTAVHISDEIRQYITSQLGLVRP
jgi:hypothetical protein